MERLSSAGSRRCEQPLYNPEATAVYTGLHQCVMHGPAGWWQVGAPCAAATSGKVFFEVEILTASRNYQFGWATGTLAIHSILTPPRSSVVTVGATYLTRSL